MPVYRFNTYGWKSHFDEDGLDLKDANTACEHAIRYLGELLRDYAGDDTPDRNMTMVVYDEADAALCELSFDLKRN